MLHFSIQPPLTPTNDQLLYTSHYTRLRNLQNNGAAPRGWPRNPLHAFYCTRRTAFHCTRVVHNQRTIPTYQSCRWQPTGDYPSLGHHTLLSCRTPVLSRVPEQEPFTTPCSSSDYETPGVNGTAGNTTNPGRAPTRSGTSIAPHHPGHPRAVPRYPKAVPRCPKAVPHYPKAVPRHPKAPQTIQGEVRQDRAGSCWGGGSGNGRATPV